MNKKILYGFLVAALVLNISPAFAKKNFTVEQQPVYQQQYTPYQQYPAQYQQYPAQYQQYPAQYQQPYQPQTNSYDVNNSTTQYPLPPYQTDTTDQSYQTQYPLPNYQAQQYPAQYQQPLQGNVVMVPAGTTFPVVTTSSLSSSTASAGENVSFALSSDFYYGGKLIAAAGSRVNGTVTKVRKAGLAGKNGRLAIRFTNIVTPMGQMIPISGMVKTADGTGVLYASAAKDTAIEYAKDVGIGAGLGAALGTAMGPLSGGSVGRGAIYGTAIGAIGGVGSAVMHRGENVELPANVQIEITIDQPITVNSNTNF